MTDNMNAVVDNRLHAGEPVMVQISAGQWWQLRGTNVQVTVEGGPLVRLVYRVVPVAPTVKPEVKRAETKS